MKEEQFLKTISISLRVLSWFLLIYGIFASITISATIAPALLLSRWSGVAVLVFFILVFLFINLVIKIAQIVFEIKKKL